MASQTRKHHLTDLEFSDLLFGEQPEAGVAEHLSECDHCRREFEAVGGSLSSFRQLSTVWAQAKAPATVGVPSVWARRLVSIPTWGTGLVVTTAAGILAFALGLPTHPAPKPGNVAVDTPAAKTDLAADNRLMVNIDEELSYSAPVNNRRNASRHDLQSMGSPGYNSSADPILE